MKDINMASIISSTAATQNLLKYENVTYLF